MISKFIKFSFKVILITLVLIATMEYSNVLADDLSEGGSGLQIAGTEEVDISSDIDKRPLGDVIKDMVNYFLGFLGFVAVIMFVYAGVLWVVSGGDEGQIEKAKKIMTYAVLGIVVIILSYSIVRFITGSAGEGQTCAEDADCPNNAICNQDNFCEAKSEGGSSCETDTDCGLGFVCANNFCAQPQGAICLSSLDCAAGQYCNKDSVCMDGKSQVCNENSDCQSPEQCDSFNFCHNPNGGSGSACQDNTDCATGYVCNGDTNSCEIQGTGGKGGKQGGETESLTEESLNAIDGAINQLGKDLNGLEDDFKTLSEDIQLWLEELFTQNPTLKGKVDSLENFIDNPGLLGPLDETTKAILKRLLSGLANLMFIEDELLKLEGVMPESVDTLAALKDTNDALKELADAPTSSIKLKQFENNYKILKDLIRKFPIVKSVIKAVPAEGNVPFTVTLDGLDSVDPTGGTISEYKWSLNGVSLGDKPVITHEFTEPNSYNIKLQVSTANKDAEGYKTAMDGVSNIIIKANPPASRVAFRINGVEPLDVHNITLEEAKAGVDFDPALTVPALGRKIEKYEWFYGDTLSEVRTSNSAVEHTYTKPGEYFVTLKVTDDQKVTDKRVVKLVVKSLAAQIDILPKEGNVNTEFRFRGIESRSDDGIITDYAWQIFDKNAAVVATSDEENFYHTFESPGKYNIELTITDTIGNKDKATRELNVISRKPVASFSYTIPRQSHPNIIEFNAAGSYDPDMGDSVTYSWDFDGDGKFEIVDKPEISVTYEYRRTGTFKVILQVQDAFGQRTQTERTVTIDSILSAEIQLKKKAVRVGEEVEFTAISSGAVAYLWEFGDGETSSSDQKTVTHIYTKEGKYQVRLNFFDRDDNKNTVSAYVLVSEGNSPIAFNEVSTTGGNQTLIEDLCGPGKDGYQVTRTDNLSFNASNSINLDGSSRLLTYDWRFSDGTRNTKRDFTYRFPELTPTGKCSTVSLVVRDETSGKASTEDVLYFKVVNLAPTIMDFVMDGEMSKNLITPTKVRLKIVGAKDEDGQIKKYRWWYYREGFENDKLGVHTTTNPETEMIITAQGEAGVKNKYFFVAELTDNDNGIYETSDQFGGVSSIEVTNGPNLSPVSEFTADKTTISVGDSITFLSKSYDPQGDQLPNSAFQWDFDGDGAFEDVSSGPQINRQFNTPGEYEVRLKVIHRGLSSTARQMVKVEPTNSFPQATFTYSIDGNTVKFNASNSAYDPDLTDGTLRYEWDFNSQEDANGNSINDDDVQSTETDPVFTYDEARSYKVRLKVKDSLGAEGVAVRDVDLTVSSADRLRNTYNSLVVQAQNQALTLLNISASPFQLAKGATVDVTARIVNADNSVYTGSVFFELLEGTGEFSPNPVKAVDSKAQTVFSSIDPGSVRIRVTATDTYYGDITEDLIINVQ